MEMGGKPVVEIRKIYPNGGSYVVALPKDDMALKGWTVGDKVIVEEIDEGFKVRTLPKGVDLDEIQEDDS